MLILIRIYFTCNILFACYGVCVKIEETKKRRKETIFAVMLPPLAFRDPIN